MSNAFDKFRALQTTNKHSKDAVAVQFISRGFPSLRIQDLNTSKYIDAALVYNNSEFRHGANIYVKDEDRLEVGGTYELEVDQDKILVIDEDFIAKTLNFSKYLSVVCNVQLDAKNWAYFRSQNLTSMNVGVKSAVELSTQKPLLIAKIGLLNIEDIVMVNSRPWKVVEANEGSNINVGYYILQPTTAPKDSDDVPNEVVPEDNLDYIEVLPLQLVVVPTQEGYFSSSINLENLNIQLNQVSFVVPADAIQFSIQVKGNLGIENVEYKVVL
jgi:hypothetical protein